MTPKEFLGQAWHIDGLIDRKLAEIERLDEKRQRIMARLTAGRVSNLSGMPRGGGYDWTNGVEAAMQTDEAIKGVIASIRSEVMELCRVKREVGEAIDAVDDMRYRRVLECRYRNYMTWEAIGDELGYDRRHVLRLHGEALMCVKVPKNAEATNERSA